jgi:hypothetical protein
MTSKFSIDNRELLQRISSGDAVVGIDFGNLIVRELAAFRLAAMDSEPVGMFRKSAVGYTPSYHEDAVPLYRHAQPVVPDDVQRDAKRWRALLGSARIRILGSAGFDATAHPGENPDYRHFGMEIWTHYPNWLHEKNEYGIDTLTQYADAMLAAAPQLPGSEPATVPGKWIPVSEQMPENDGAYLCWDNRYVTTYAFIFGTWQENQFVAKNITHWMPLPNPPKE